MIARSISVVLLMAVFALTCENRPWAEDYGKNCAKTRAVILGLQPGSGGWNEIEPKTYVKFLNNESMQEIKGIWGKPGATLSVDKKWVTAYCPASYYVGFDWKGLFPNGF